MEAVATSSQDLPKESKRYSVPEYLETELRTGERHAYYNGKIQAMAGGSIPHKRIARNILSELHFAFKSKPRVDL